MSGINKILDIIDSQSRKNAEILIKNAEKKAAEIRLEGEKKAAMKYDEVIKKYKTACNSEYKYACSSADSSAKRELLSCRISCIDDVIQRAVEKTSELSVPEYFSLITKLAGAHLRSGCGVLQFSAGDLARMPEDFEKNLKLLAAVDNLSVEISKEPVDIDGGFILSYGKISENCSFREIAAAKKNELREMTSEILFGR